MDFIISHIKAVWPAGGLALIILTLKFSINNYDASTIEIKLLPNTKKITILLSMVFTISFPMTLIFVISEFNEIDIKNLTYFLISLFIGTVLLSVVILILLIIIVPIVLIFTAKYTFYIESDQGERWYIYRRANKKKVLLRDTKNRYRFYDSSLLMDKIICREKIPLGNIKLSIYKKVKAHKIWYFISLIISVVLVLVVMIFIKNIVVRSVCYLILIIIISILGAIIKLDPSLE